MRKASLNGVEGKKKKKRKKKKNKKKKKKKKKEKTKTLSCSFGKGTTVVEMVGLQDAPHQMQTSQKKVKHGHDGNLMVGGG